MNRGYNDNLSIRNFNLMIIQLIDILASPFFVFR